MTELDAHLADHLTIDFACGDIVVPTKSDIHKTLIISYQPLALVKIAEN